MACDCVLWYNELPVNYTLFLAVESPATKFSTGCVSLLNQSIESIHVPCGWGIRLRRVGPLAVNDST